LLLQATRFTVEILDYTILSTQASSGRGCPLSRQRHLSNMF